MADLARRLVEAMPGLWAPGMRYPEIRGGSGRHAWTRSGGRVRDDSVALVPRDATPDLDDPATAGVLLARLAAEVERLEVRYLGDGSVLLVWSTGSALGLDLGLACAEALIGLRGPGGEGR